MAAKPRTSAAFCTDCGERIIWATTEAGNRQALTPRPNPLGSVMAYQDATGAWHARSISSGSEKRHPLEKTYMPHAATCVPSETEDPPYDERDNANG